MILKRLKVASEPRGFTPAAMLFRVHVITGP